MNDRTTVSFEELNAFVDGELDPGAAARVLAAIDGNDQLKHETCTLRALRDQLRHTYDLKRLGSGVAGRRESATRWYHGLAAALLLVAGGLAGWQGQAFYQGDSELGWERLVQIQPQGDARRLILHVGDSNQVRFDNTIDEARDMLEAARAKRQHVQIEILANGPGLNLLRTNTATAAGKLAQLQAEFPDLALVACGQGLQRLKVQGADVRLLPGVKTADSALDEIVRRMHQGWAYLRVGREDKPFGQADARPPPSPPSREGGSDRLAALGRGKRLRLLLAGRPGILERHRAVEYRRARLRVAAIGDEVAVALKLEAIFRLRVPERGFELRGDD
jgi:uncharacterized protein